MGFRSRAWSGYYSALMEFARHRMDARARFENTPTAARKLGPWGVYGEAIGNPKFYVGTDPKDSEFLQAAEEFASAHEDVLRALAKH